MTFKRLIEQIEQRAQARQARVDSGFRLMVFYAGQRNIDLAIHLRHMGAKDVLMINDGVTCWCTERHLQSLLDDSNWPNFKYGELETND